MSSQARGDPEGLCIPFERIAPLDLRARALLSLGCLIDSLTKHILAMMAERRMPEIVSKPGRLDDIGIETTPSGDHVG